MKTKNELIAEKEEIEKQIQKIENQEKMKDFVEFESEGKKFKIYKWEDKPFGELIKNLPENEKLSTFQEFNEAVENLIFVMETGKYYITKHWNKLQWKKEYCLSGLFLSRYLNLNSDYEYLEYSNDYGRVVVIVEDGK